ncbi:MAG TPA: POTRA domain-containing protein [Verrucomicrobiae bacterium]|nr:POTRA domain-containing protein [Verrucomicrobiae bacterium]
MTKATSRLLFGLLAAGLCLAAVGHLSQLLAQMPASARQLMEIKVTGSKRFSQDAIIATTALQIGMTAGDEDFKKAARRLGETGAFTDIAYNFSYSAQGTKLEFHVTDSPNFVPAHFEDFVWFSDAELRRRIQQHVPLFDGELPTNGDLPNEVSDVLQALLVEGAIPGHVDYVRTGKSDGPVESIDYSVSDVVIRVRNLGFTGIDDEQRSALATTAQAFSGREYSRTRLDAFVQHQLLPVFHQRGYLKAVCGEPQPKVVQPPSSTVGDNEGGPRNQTIVDVTFVVTPGSQYKLKSLEWMGNKEFSTDTLAKMVHMEVGKPADTVRLGDDLKSIQKLYGSKGFITESIKADAQFDEAAELVAIVLSVKEGPVFHMGDLQFRGLDNNLTAKLREAWKIRQGDIYDSTYLDEYLPEAHKLLPTRLDWDVAPHVTANVADKTVDVDLIYSVNAPAPE